MSLSKMIEWTEQLEQTLNETYAWAMNASSRTRLTYPGNFPDSRIDLDSSIDVFYKNNSKSHALIEDITKGIVERRREEMRRGMIAPVEYSPANGRLLLSEPYSTIADGSGQAASEGFVGHPSDLPPTDTWIGYFTDGKIGEVLSFVPKSDIDRVQCAMDCNPMEGQHWFEEKYLPARFRIK